VEGDPVRPNAIGIIGGQGRMGMWLDRLFGDSGYQVLISDKKSGKTPREIVSKCNVIIVAVPIHAFEEVIRDIGPLVPKEALICDIASLKDNQVRLMLEHSQAEVIGTHPLFGPQTDSLNGKLLFTCTARAKQWVEWFCLFFEKKGIRLVEIAPKKHDHLMAYIQVLRHILLLSFGHTLMRLGFDLKANLDISGPWFNMLIGSLTSQLQQSPELWADIALNNTTSKEVLDGLCKTVEEISQSVVSKDRKALLTMIEETSSYIRSAGCPPFRFDD
jgi:prephenate dehydrogenase